MVIVAIRALELEHLFKIFDWGRSRYIFTDSDSTALLFWRNKIKRPVGKTEFLAYVESSSPIHLLPVVLNYNVTLTSIVTEYAIFLRCLVQILAPTDYPQLFRGSSQSLQVKAVTIYLVTSLTLPFTLSPIRYSPSPRPFDVIRIVSATDRVDKRTDRTQISCSSVGFYSSAGFYRSLPCI
jgi:hypothetical protein